MEDTIKIIELVGPPGIGKSTISAQILKNKIFQNYHGVFDLALKNNKFQIAQKEKLKFFLSRIIPSKSFKRAFKVGIYTRIENKLTATYFDNYNDFFYDYLNRILELEKITKVNSFELIRSIHWFHEHFKRLICLKEIQKLLPNEEIYVLLDEGIIGHSLRFTKQNFEAIADNTLSDKVFFLEPSSVTNYLDRRLNRNKVLMHENQLSKKEKIDSFSSEFNTYLKNINLLKSNHPENYSNFHFIDAEKEPKEVFKVIMETIFKKF